jgi:hypothetical protein
VFLPVDGYARKLRVMADVKNMGVLENPKLAIVGTGAIYVLATNPYDMLKILAQEQLSLPSERRQVWRGNRCIPQERRGRCSVEDSTSKSPQPGALGAVMSGVLGDTTANLLSTIARQSSIELRSSALMLSFAPGEQACAMPSTAVRVMDSVIDVTARSRRSTLCSAMNPRAQRSVYGA